MFAGMRRPPNQAERRGRVHRGGALRDHLGRQAPASLVAPAHRDEPGHGRRRRGCRQQRGAVARRLDLHAARAGAPAAASAAAAAAFTRCARCRPPRRPPRRTWLHAGARPVRVLDLAGYLGCRLGCRTCWGPWGPCPASRWVCAGTAPLMCAPSAGNGMGT